MRFERSRTQQKPKRKSSNESWNLRDRGVKAVSVNTWLRVIKAYWLWHQKPWTIGRLKEEQKSLGTLTDEHVRKLLAFKPASFNQRRAHLVALTILDTGLRATEALSLTKEQIDFDNLVVRVVGKGNKHRLVPFSHQLRKALWRYSQNPRFLLFGTQNNTTISVRILNGISR